MDGWYMVGYGSLQEDGTFTHVVLPIPASDPVRRPYQLCERCMETGSDVPQSRIPKFTQVEKDRARRIFDDVPSADDTGA